MIDFNRRYFPTDSFECSFCQKQMKVISRIVCCEVEYSFRAIAPIVRYPGFQRASEYKLNKIHYKNLEFVISYLDNPVISIFINGKSQAIRTIEGDAIEKEELFKMQKLSLL